MTSPLMTVPEVAAYLRLGERKIYDLVSRGDIPCVRVTGKLLFPRAHIDLWLTERADLPQGMPRRPQRPPVITGSHDMLLEWAVRQSGCALALLMDGSGNGLRRFAEGGAVACGVHVVDPDTGVFNGPAVERALVGVPAVRIHWARRETGLVLPAGNPSGIRTLADFANADITFADRPPGAGGHILLRHLMRQEGLPADGLWRSRREAVNEADVASLILEGKAGAGFAPRAAANRFGLTFIPLAWDEFDIVIERRDYFDPPFQALLRYARSPALVDKARLLGGYDISGLGEVRHNAP
ncbi:hypothetical protein C882_0322 [Caenispirillum salinarum AK4]|uniref:Uncharacterized protein n=1 Tax=Caenispirillum salinarum AK4 TaxID=1238182 RepID=K9GU42_9PROT|nr:helix-turn-helix transcriptional regulator [Caenispirillum salinarum]EKV29500.1 hypothetical protein C882_0322 [Caenispirillum salinarum AK4]